MAISGTNRITWKGISLGDHAYISFAYSGNADVRIVPRAKGVIIRSTEEMGGGVMSIVVRGIKVEDTRLALEQYFGQIDATLDLVAPGTLVIGGTFTLTNCYLESLDQNEDDLKSNTFTFKFLKSL